VSLDDYSFDDLHLIALNEFEANEGVVQFLNESYDGFRAQYIELLEGLRTVREFVA